MTYGKARRQRRGEDLRPGGVTTAVAIYWTRKAQGWNPVSQKGDPRVETCGVNRKERHVRRTSTAGY